MRRAAIALVLFAVALGAVPWLQNDTLRVLSDVYMMASLALGWNLIGGITGYPSFATAGFFGLGAYTVAGLMVRGVPFVVSLAVAAMLAGAGATLLGLGVLRLRGHYFAIATFGFAEALKELVTNLALLGAGTGLNLPVFLGSPRAFTVYFYVALLAVLGCSVATTAVLLRRPMGYGLRAIRENEDAAEMAGVNTRVLKSAAFGLSGILSAVPGGVYAYRAAYIEPSDVFDVLWSVKPIIVAVVGGAGTVMGPLIGAGVFEMLKDVLWGSLLNFHTAVFGAVVALMVVFAPRGLLDLARHWRRLRTPRGLIEILGANVRQHRV